MFKRENFRENFNKNWDSYIKQLKIYSPYHQSWMLNFQLKSQNSRNLSFAFLEGKRCLALIPLAIYKDELSFGGWSCPSPIVNFRLREPLRRKIFKEIFNNVNIIMKKNNLNEYYFSRQTFEKRNSNNELVLENLFELISFSDKASVYNNLVIDLSRSVQNLENNLSKYHKKNIKSSRNKLTIDIIDHKIDNKKLDYYFNEFRKLHFKSAGRETRSLESWDIMKNCIKKKNANLFVAKYNLKNISFLFCGKHDIFAFGWSQVNDDAFEKEFMPRHYLEWSAILFYKKIGLRFYNLGERFYNNSDGEITNKQLNISYFKEKYGSAVYPKIQYIKKI